MARVCFRGVTAVGHVYGREFAFIDHQHSSCNEALLTRSQCFLIGGFQVVLPGLNKSLSISAEELTWPSTILTLVAGSFLFPMGRLTDMIGGYLVFNVGLAWFVLWTVVAGFANSLPVLTICRAMEGLGASAFLPAGISLLGRIYRPGPRKNLIFGLYGALGPVGFFGGIMTAGATQELSTWRWYFWSGGILAGICCVGTLLSTPNDHAQVREENVKMDWWGFCTMTPGLMLVIYAISNTSTAPNGWASPQIITTLAIGVCFLAFAVYIEGWVAKSPLIPPDIFHVQFMKRMLLCLFLTWGAFAIYLFYVQY
jgi:MFS family permease